MSAGSIVSRVARGTLLASLITAVTLAAAAALISHWLWRAGEARALEQAAAALGAATRREAADEGWPLQRAAPEALRESGLSGYRIEVWDADHLIAANMTGASLGLSRPEGPPAGWLVAERSIAGRLRVVVAAPSRDREALRVFGWSLLLAAPLCLAVAAGIGRVVGSRATGSLVELQRRILALRPLEPPPERGIAGAPDEVAELEGAFRTLWSGLSQALAREAEFVANASHELRTPLTRIRFQAERARADAGPVALAALAEQAREVDRTVRLVESLLALARDVSAGVPGAEAVNLADALRAIVARALPAGRVLVEELPDEALVRGDEELLGVAVENLLDNAAKFSSPERPVRVRLAEGDGRVRLAVSSPGACIGLEERKRIFERFYRGPEARVAPRGHGLGLALARHVARLHRGELRCVSGPDEDAAFELELPGWTAAGKI